MKFSLPPSKLQSQQAFDYYALPLHEREYLQQKTSKIKNLIQKTAEVVRELGKDLAEVRDFLRHNKTGGFDGWLKLEFQWKRRTAYNYIAVYEIFGNCANLAQLAPSVLYLLASPSTPEEARHEALERAAQGEVITYALAMAIRSHYTIDVEAEVVDDDEACPNPIQPSPVAEIHFQTEPVNELLSPTTEPGILTDATLQPAESQQAPEKLDSSARKEPAPVEDFKVGDHIRILCRQHGEDNWSGKSAWIWEITPDSWLRVDVEGHPGVKFTLKPEWVERMPEEISEQQNEQPEQVLDESWADEPDPESPAIVEAPTEVKPEGKATPQFRAGDRLQVTNLGKSNQQWTGEVAEVVEAAENCIKVIVEIRPAV